MDMKKTLISTLLLILSLTISANDWETAQVATGKMTTGLNIGNTLDAYGNWFSGTSPKDYETCWGNPQITRELIKAYKNGGFNALRLPVTWYQNMDANDNVREAWMNRVEEVVNYILDEGMYCILNVHHDTGAGDEAWLLADLANIGTIQARFEKLWTQIATRFEKYDDRLIFEGYNEMLDGKKRWSSTDANGYKAHNLLAQAFVTTVRQTGGNNAKRNLLVNTYSADPGQTSVNNFIIPTDEVEGHLMIGAHVYTPGGFTAAEKGTAPVWTAAWQTELEPYLKRLHTTFVAQGYPVIVGEWGANDVPTELERCKYAHFFIRKCKEYGLASFYWFDIINRKTYAWTLPTLKDVLLGKEVSGIEEPETPEIPTGGKVLFEGEHHLEYAEGGSLFIKGDALTDISEGSVLVIEAEKIDAQAAGWWYQLIVYFNEPWTKMAEFTDTLPLVYTLTADDAEKLKNNGMQIQGHGIIVSKVMVTTSETNGIKSVTANNHTQDGIYTLAGAKMQQRRENLPKGIYIIGNKKVIIK